MTAQLICVENKSTVLTPRDLGKLVWAVNYQVAFHYGRSAWVTHGLAPRGHVVLLKAGVKPPVGAWNLILLDSTDQAGALGYHDDAAGSKIPYSDVFCKTALDDGADPTSVASHEALEMLVDPDVTKVRTALRADTHQQYIVEVCDPVEGFDYDVGAPEGRPTGTRVSDFCLPSWWNLAFGGPFSFRNSVFAPFQLGPQGYISTAPEGADTSDPSVWSQIFGAQQDRLPNWASRLPRIHG